MALIFLRIQDFWCLETRGAEISSVETIAIFSFKFCCETEVNNLAIILFVEQDIFELHVTMADAV
jgi:hypothetical protein